MTLILKALKFEACNIHTSENIEDSKCSSNSQKVNSKLSTQYIVRPAIDRTFFLMLTADFLYFWLEYAQSIVKAMIKV